MVEKITSDYSLCSNYHCRLYNVESIVTAVQLKLNLLKQFGFPGHLTPSTNIARPQHRCAIFKLHPEYTSCPLIWLDAIDQLNAGSNRTVRISPSIWTASDAELQNNFSEILLKLL